MTKSKITGIQGAGENKGYHNFEFEFEDGYTGKRGFKTQEHGFYIGQEVNYEQHKDYDTLLSKLEGVGKAASSAPTSNTTQFKADPDKQASIELQVCLKEAINYHNANGFKPAVDSVDNLQEIVDTTKFLYGELFNK